MSEVTNTLHQYILNLISHLKDRESANLAVYTIEDISRICINTPLNRKEIAYSCSLIFKRKEGFLEFLEGSVNFDALKSARIQGLQFLSSFLDVVGSKVLQYGIDIKEVAFSIFLRDQVAKAKTLALAVVTKVMCLCSGRLSPEELKIQEIVKKVIEHLAQASSKIAPTVKQQIFHLLGVLAHHYPECLGNYSDRLQNWYLDGLKRQIKSSMSKLEPSIVTGCLQGLSEFLYQFPILSTEEPEKSYALYTYIRDILGNTETNRYEMTKAALVLLSLHSPVFGQFLYEDSVNMYDRIAFWMQHSNREVKHAGYDALDALLKQVSEMLIQDYEEEEARGRSLFKFFIEKFKSRMKSSYDSRGLSSAVKGYGYFAKACRLYLGESDVRYMLNDMIKRSEQFYLSKEIMLEERIQTLPGFTDSIASIVLQLDEVSEASLLFLERLAVFQIEHFPVLPVAYSFLCYNSLIRLMSAVSLKGSSFIIFLNRIVYQGIIRTCSHPVVFEVEAKKDQKDDSGKKFDDPREITYKSYMPLWKNILNIVQNKELNFYDITLEHRHKLSEAIYDEIVTVVLLILQKLDLNTSEPTDIKVKVEISDEQDVFDTFGMVSDPLYQLQPSKPKDFQVFINIVDFTRDFLLEKQPSLFEKWVYTFGMNIVQHINKNPYVSGFYKLASVCLTLSSRIKYFQDIKKIESASDSELNTLDKERVTAFKLFAKFSREVMVQLQQFKDDLLASCLGVILSLPVEIVESEIQFLIPALQIAFSLGLSFLPLAFTSLDTLECWVSALPVSVLRSYYPDILPLLNDYFLTTANTQNEPLNKISTFGKTTTSRKISKRTVLYDNNKAEVYDSELTKVQHRILKLLGSLGNQYNSSVTAITEATMNETVISWDSDIKDHLKFPLPLIDMKLDISLDKFLPRIVKLATSSSNRHTKVAACELLHAVVLYMVGCDAQKTEELQKKYPMKKLYINVLPALLQLACDVELVARQLFEPLVLQLIHWFTSKRMVGSEETTMFLQVIWDGLTQSKDTAYRDFSAKCLKEFVQWSIKQTSKKEQQKSPINMKAVLNRLYNYSLHPSPFKRMGAALAFNSTYTIFREEESLVNMFTLEILVYFVDSLAISHYDEKSLGTQEKCKQALDHLARIVKMKSSLLSKQSKERRALRNIKDATLPSVVDWLLECCGCLQTECRHKCMELVFQFAPCLPGCKEPKDYFSKLLEKKGSNFFINCFEREMPDFQPNFNGENFNFKAAKTWMESLLTMLDCYTWLFGQQIFKLHDIFSEKDECRTKLINAFDHYLSSLCSGNFDAAGQTLTNMNYTLGSKIISPKEKAEYTRIACTVTVRILNFITVVVEKNPDQLESTVLSKIWSENLLKCIFLSVINPFFLGFDVTDIEITSQLPKETSALLDVLKKYLPKNLGEAFKSFAFDFLSRKNTDINQLFRINLNNSNFNGLRIVQLISGYEQLFDCKIWPSENIKEQVRNSLINNIFSSLWKGFVQKTANKSGAITLGPTVLKISKNLLTLGLKIGIKSRDLILRLLDKQSHDSGHSPSSGIGIMVFTTFQDEITRFAAAQPDSFIIHLLTHIHDDKGTVVKILLGILETVGKTKELRKRYGKEIIKCIITNWDTIQRALAPSDDDEESDILSVLAKILIIDSSIATDFNCPEFKLIFNTYSSLLTAKKSLGFKISALDLLPFFICGSQEHINEIENLLDSLAANHFPILKTEFPVGSPQYNDYKIAFTKILQAMELTESPMLLKFVIKALCRESSHLLDDDIQNSFYKMSRRSNSAKQKLLVGVSYKIFLEEDLFSPEMRMQIMERACVSLLRGISLASLHNFFVDNISEIMLIIKNKRKKSDENHLVTKIGAFRMLEIMYTRLPKEDLQSKESSINASFCAMKVETGKELTTELTRCAHAARKENMGGEKLAPDICRKYHCAAYNTIIAVISCTQTDVKFYNAFLFQENTMKLEHIWENIVDLNREYIFDIEFDAPMERKKKFISIRGERKLVKEDKGNSPQQHSSVHYISSAFLADSSLSEEVSHFDFSTSELAFSSSLQTGSTMQESKSHDSIAVEGTSRMQENPIEIEVDDLNKHECMVPLIALLQHMSKTGILSTSPKEIPKWMDGICKKLEDTSVHRNVKVFITKLIINTADVLQPYASYLLYPLMSLILNGTFGLEINYFILDAMVVLLSWSSVAIPEDSSIGKHAASSVLEFMMQHCFHPRQDVFRNNLEMIKTIIECWKERLDVPIKVIFDNMHKQDIASKDNIVGIQLLGIVIANGMSPFRSGMGIDKLSFLKPLVRNMKNKYRDVYSPAAEVSGMIMDYYSTRDSDLCESFCTITRDCIMELSGMKRDQFLICLNKIQHHFPSFIDSGLLNKVLYMLPGVHGIYRTLILEIIQSHVEVTQEIFVDLKSKGFLNMLEHRDETVQLHSLKIIQNMLQILTVDDMLVLFPIISKLHRHCDPSCRNVIYEIMMHVYEKFCTAPAAKEREVFRYSQEQLLFGLADKDLALRLTVHNFWSDGNRLPVDTIHRIKTVLQNMYSPATECQFLQYATFLLMEMTSRSPDYNRNLFPHPLSSCKFQHYTVSASWRKRHAPMTPLFIDSLSQEGSLSGSFGNAESVGDNVRTTIEQHEFDPTQDQAPRDKTYNWLTETSIDTMGDWGSLEQASSSLLFTVGRQIPLQKSPRKKDGVEADNKVAGTTEKTEMPSIFRLRRRFLKDKEKTRLFFVRAEMRRKQLREEKEKEQKEKREAQVTMYRQYRIGELPDIEIPHSAIIKPLQALAQHDGEICRMLFQSLVSSVCTNIKSENPDEYLEFCRIVSDAINNILKKSTMYNPAVIVFCEEVLYQDVKQMSIVCEEISTASQASNKQNIGILLLEDTIISADDLEVRSSRKMARHSKPEISKETFLWIKMAEIYKSITDYDTVRGIFNCSIQTQPETGQALELEARGDFVAAAKIYSELYNQTEWPGNEPNQAEIDMWDEALLQCYNSLTKWDHLEATVLNHLRGSTTGQIDFDRVWEDTYYQEHYLPFLIRSKLKILIESREDQSLLDFVDGCMKEESRKKYMEQHFPEELSLLHIIQEKYDIAQYYANCSAQSFLTEWASLNVLTPSVRERKLQTLQKLIELQEFLQFMENEGSFRNKYCFKILVNKWLKRFPSICDPIEVWDDIIMNRSLYMEKIHGRYEKCSISSLDESLDNSVVLESPCDFDTTNFLMENRLIMKLKFTEAALHQGNVPVAIKHLKWTQQVARKLSVDHHWISIIHMYCKAYLQKASRQIHPHNLETLLHAQSQLAKLESEFPLKLDVLAMKHYSLHGQVLENMADIVIERASSNKDVDRVKLEELKNFVTFHSTSQLGPSLLHKSYELKCRVSDIAKAIKEEKPDSDSIKIGEAFMEMANFCNRCLRRKEEMEAENLESLCVERYPIMLINSLLDAMRYGNADARRLFPRILQVIGSHPESISNFIEKASSVPCWMYLSWINQLVALLDKPEGAAVHNIVEKIANEYPNALVYPFKLSSEGYIFSKTPEGQKNKEFVLKLKSSLSQLPLIEDFISALHHLSVPHLEFKEFCGRILALKKRNAEKEEINGLIKKMWESLFTRQGFRNNVGIGHLHLKVIEKFAPKAASLFGEKGNKILSMKLEDFHSKYQDLLKEMTKSTPLPGEVHLKNLSSWLSEFQSLKYSSELEIPGQYHGKSKPLPEYHIKICSFDQSVLVLKSLTLPRRLTIRGNDEKEYKFLVKAGEDLRQDNRIEQLFLLMNDIYASDAVCSQRKLKLETYKVIPLTSRIGLIEWVDNTKVLRDFLKDAMTSEEMRLYEKASTIYDDFMSSKAKDKDKKHLDRVYGNFYKTSNKEVCQKFNECLSMVPWNLFRRSFLKLSASLEAFVVLRSRFITSHSVLCISQWLLGVGDRHSSNFIISLNSGVEIGIDFGHAFGTATQFLPIPELMPFRLTQQYLNLMLPMKEKGVIQATMIAALSALRKNWDILLNTMDVFIKEPTVNWKENALKQKDAEALKKDSDDMGDLSWYPKQRILFAKLKLQGINPCYITREELVLGHGKKEYFRNYEEVCMGGDKSIRVKLPRSGLSVEEQVASLIDQATDPCILGRTYRGWEPWL